MSEPLLKSLPAPAASLTPPAKLPPPQAQHFVPKRLPSVLVTRYRLVPEISANHHLESGVDPPAWFPLAPSERSTPLRSAPVLRSARPDRRFGSAGPVSRPALRRSDLPSPDRAAPLIQAAPEWRRYILRPEIPIPAARRIRSSARIRSAPPSGWRWCDSPSGDPRTRAHK